MILLIVSVLVVLGVSAACSLSEASLYAVQLPFVRRLKESGSRAGATLAQFKENMEQPISAILILNTVANTAGAVIAGGQARTMLGEVWMIWFSAAFTLAVLTFSEIVPKVIGVVYSSSIARAVARPVAHLIALLYPAIWLIQFLTRFLRPKGPVLAAPEEEVAEMAKLSADEGSILQFEADLIQHVLRLNDIHAIDLMTPRAQVFDLPANVTLRELRERITEGSQSRIPIRVAGSPTGWTGIVLRRDLLGRLARGQFDTTLQSLSTPMHFVNAQTPGHVLLKQFIQRRSHLFGILDRAGQAVGVVSLDDVLEALLGREIKDEVDARKARKH